MAGVSTQFSIQDRDVRLNTMTSAAERLNRSLDTTDALSDTIDPRRALRAEAAGDIGAGKPPRSTTSTTDRNRRSAARRR